MEESKIVKRLVRRPVDTANKPVDNNNTFFKVLNVIMFIMVFVIFIRGFNVKNTVREESINIQKEIKDALINLDNSRQIDKNETLAAFALYSRLDMASLKEREEYHKIQQAKFENMAKQYNQGLNNLVKEIKSPKDSIK